MLDLHFWPTPNGKKVTILIEELGLKYNLVPCNIGRGDQFKPEFLKINPNHRMPVLVDHEPKGGGAPISIFESGAIMMYLAEKEGRFFPQDLRGKYEVTQWVIWQMANQGPKLGECGHFRRAGPDAGDLSNWQAQGQDIGEFKHFKRWFDEVGGRPAVKRGMETGNNLRVDPASLSAAEREQMRKIMYNQRAIPAPA
jgi:GST-like protein